MTTDIRSALNPVLVAGFFALPPEEQLVEATDIIDQLRAVMKEISDARRSAVRDLRITGYSLAEIGEMVGTTPQRIHQIETGYNRKEKADRKTPRKPSIKGQ